MELPTTSSLPETRFLWLPVQTASERISPIVPETKWRWRILAMILVLTSCYVAVLCPLDLAPDEAHYWQWSRQLDASYYSKGPLTALLIRASCELFGQTAFAVRFPAVVCGGLLLAGVYVLTARCFANERLALLVTGLAVTMPALAVSRTLMTIDAPFACLWTWALVVGHQAFIRRSAWALPILGVVIGLGILAKYTMALWIPSAALFLVLSREHRFMLRRPGFWIMCGVAGLCCLPILSWNVQHDWVSFRHVGGQAGIAIGGNHVVRWLGPFQYIAEQFGLLLGLGFVVWVCAAIVFRPSRARDPVRRYLWCLSIPMFLFFGLFSLRTEVLPNWPATAYISGLVLAAPWLVAKWSAAGLWPRRLLAGTAVGFAALGILASAFLHDSTPFRPILIAISGPPTPSNPQPLRRIDPTCRLRGWRAMAAAVDQVCVELRAQEIEPVLASSRWTLASEMAFYCDGQPTVYSLGSALWDRQSQFDIWRPNPILDPDSFLGRTFVFVDVGQVPREIRQAFERIESTQTVRYEQDEQLVAFWNVTVCHGFKGLNRARSQHY